MTSTEASTSASDVAPLAQPPVAGTASPRRNVDSEDNGRMAQRLPLSGVLETSDALRMVGLVRKLPFQFISAADGDGFANTRDAAWEADSYDPDPEPRERRSKGNTARPTSVDEVSAEDDDPQPNTFSDQTELARSDGELSVDEDEPLPAPLLHKKELARSDDELSVDEDEETPPSPLVQNTELEDRKRKQKPKRPATSAPIRGSSSSCCKQSGGGGGTDDEMTMRRETARVNLDVLRRLASMLGEEREKFMAERQMLSASRDMMMAETRKVNSERGKIDSERQKVDLERDLLQSQMLGRRSPRLAYLSNAP